MKTNPYDIEFVYNELGCTREQLEELTLTGSVIEIKSDFFKRGMSDIHGYGMFAKKDIEKNQYIGMASIDNKYKTYLGRYVNHSRRPNIKFIFTDTGDLITKSIKEIKTGEELFVDYTNQFLTPEYL